MPTFPIKRNDRLPLLRATLTRTDGTTPDVTGATVRLKTGAPLNINGLCDIINGPAGIVEYAWAVGETATKGNYRAEFEVTYASGKTETFPNDGYVTLQVYEDLG